MTGMQWLLVALTAWVLLAGTTAALAAVLLGRVRRRLVWEDRLPTPLAPVRDVHCRPGVAARVRA